MSKEEIENINKDTKISDEIKEALKEFETSRHIEYQKQAEEIPSAPIATPGAENFSEVEQALVQFEADQEKENVLKKDLEKNPKSSGMASFLIKHSGGAIKNENQANHILLAIAILIFIISGIFFYIGLKDNNTNQKNEAPSNFLSKTYFS